MPLASRILAAGLISVLAGCAGLPTGVDRPSSSAYVDTGGTRIGRALAGAVDAHPGKTGVRPLLSGRDAFAARMIIARAAERSLDVQYYIWHADTTGNLMFEAMWQAAGERSLRTHARGPTRSFRSGNESRMSAGGWAHICAATPVMPDPQNKSSTRSPGCV